MEKAVVMFGGFCIGVFFGYSVLAKMQNRKTIVTISTGIGYVDTRFTSTNNNSGDTYLITMDGDTLSSGVHDGEKWK